MSIRAQGREYSVHPSSTYSYTVLYSRFHPHLTSPHPRHQPSTRPFPVDKTATKQRPQHSSRSPRKSIPYAIHPFQILPPTPPSASNASLSASTHHFQILRQTSRQLPPGLKQRAHGEEKRRSNTGKESPIQADFVQQLSRHPMTEPLVEQRPTICALLAGRCRPEQKQRSAALRQDQDVPYSLPSALRCSAQLSSSIDQTMSTFPIPRRKHLNIETLAGERSQKGAAAMSSRSAVSKLDCDPLQSLSLPLFIIATSSVKQSTDTGIS